jgi:endonuclease/exonuclease/phosphatase family metal-dependent hydrolase
VTPPTYRKIKTRLADEFPYLTEEVQPKSSSSMVLSRFPLSEEKKLDSFLPQLSVAVDVPEIGQINLISAHPCNPYCTDGLWAEEHQQLLDRAESLPDRPTVIAGDFNAIRDHGPMRELEDHGFTSATDIVGAGWQPTFPANRWYPPIVQIDHVMVSSELTATRVDTFSVARTDHLGLLADLAGTR